MLSADGGPACSGLHVVDTFVLISLSYTHHLGLELGHGLVIVSEDNHDYNYLSMP